MDRLRSVSVLINLFLLYLGESSGDSSSCIPAIDMTGHQRFVKPPGQSLTLKCPVRTCYLGLPNVIWCKITGELCEPVRTGDGIKTNIVEYGKDSAVYLLRFDSVQVNDTGYYQCTAVFNEQQIMGSTVQIIISDVSTVRVRNDAVLNCIHSIKNFILVTWMVDFLNQSSCFLSTIGDGAQGNCSHQMHLDTNKNRTSLRIHNVEILNEGNYTCQIVNRSGTFLHTVVLKVLAQPTTFLKLNSNGSPECGAVGGNPPAEIFWIPHSDNVTTRILEEPDRTRTVISTFSATRMDETSVTCVISHPTFPNPWKGDITLRGYNLRLDNILRIIVTVIFTVLIAGRLLYLKIKSQVQNIPEEQMNEA